MVVISPIMVRLRTKRNKRKNQDLTNATFINNKFRKIKLLRAYSECLGTRRR